MKWLILGLGLLCGVVAECGGPTNLYLVSSILCFSFVGVQTVAFRRWLKEPNISKGDQNGKKTST